MHHRTPIPHDRYTGGAGEVRAVWRPTDAVPRLRNRDGSVEYLATGATTGGDYWLSRWNWTRGRTRTAG